MVWYNPTTWFSKPSVTTTKTAAPTASINSVDYASKDYSNDRVGGVTYTTTTKTGTTSQGSFPPGAIPNVNFTPSPFTTIPKPKTTTRITEGGGILPQSVVNQYNAQPQEYTTISVRPQSVVSEYKAPSFNWKDPFPFLTGKISAATSSGLAQQTRISNPLQKEIVGAKLFGFGAASYGVGALSSIRHPVLTAKSYYSLVTSSEERTNLKSTIASNFAYNPIGSAGYATAMVTTPYLIKGVSTRISNKFSTQPTTTRIYGVNQNFAKNKITSNILFQTRGKGINKVGVARSITPYKIIDGKYILSKTSTFGVSGDLGIKIPNILQGTKPKISYVVNNVKPFSSSAIGLTRKSIINIQTSFNKNIFTGKVGKQTYSFGKFYGNLPKSSNIKFGGLGGSYKIAKNVYNIFGKVGSVVGKKINNIGNIEGFIYFKGNKPKTYSLRSGGSMSVTQKAKPILFSPIFKTASAASIATNKPVNFKLPTTPIIPKASQQKGIQSIQGSQGVGFRSISKERLKFNNIQLPKAKELSGQRGISYVTNMFSQGQSQQQRQQIRNIQIQPLIQTQPQKQRLRQVPGLINPKPFTTPTFKFVRVPNPKITYLPFTSISMGSPSRILKGGKYPSSYTPSYSALLYKIGGSKQKRMETGINFRPITAGFRFVKIRPLRSLYK